MEFRTAVVPVEEIFDLRWTVLRPGLPRASAIFVEDGHPAAFHMAGYDGEGALAPVVTCVTLFPEQLPGHQEAAYRIRGMATAAEVRGRGLGSALLGAALAEARERGAELVWCNGRTSARGFWEGQGFTAVGEEFVLQPAGPHFLFVAKLV
ncbi:MULTISPECIES: GNAT family N-acetyltransferase [unclassified Streptomyces]|uniref:GNAT family N-acetyltransferase n=1 Tax=unclassified Streptomyces TaxID=2593676 RepID=UPI00380F0B8D